MLYPCPVLPPADLRNIFFSFSKDLRKVSFPQFGLFQRSWDFQESLASSTTAGISPPLGQTKATLRHLQLRYFNREKRRGGASIPPSEFFKDKGPDCYHSCLPPDILGDPCPSAMQKLKTAEKRGFFFLPPQNKSISVTKKKKYLSKFHKLLLGHHGRKLEHF